MRGRCSGRWWQRAINRPAVRAPVALPAPPLLPPRELDLKVLQDALAREAADEAADAAARDAERREVAEYRAQLAASLEREAAEKGERDALIEEANRRKQGAQAGCSGGLGGQLGLGGAGGLCGRRGGASPDGRGAGRARMLVSTAAEQRTPEWPGSSLQTLHLAGVL